jgi:hypothetical protein
MTARRFRRIALGLPGAVETASKLFRPVPGGWGKRGSTNVNLAAADEATPTRALTMAWTRVAPASPSRRS